VTRKTKSELFVLCLPDSKVRNERSALKDLPGVGGNPGRRKRNSFRAIKHVCVLLFGVGAAETSRHNKLIVTTLGSEC
jgi:hypothetical protein